MKQWYQSWTIWFNIIIVIATTINELAQIVPIDPRLIEGVTLIGNVMLRFKTTQGIIDGE